MISENIDFPGTWGRGVGLETPKSGVKNVLLIYHLTVDLKQGRHTMPGLTGLPGLVLKISTDFQNQIMWRMHFCIKILLQRKKIFAQKRLIYKFY